MTTRANITVMEDGDIMIFYQHSDGYPEGVMPMLRWFVDSMRVGAIRRNIELASGWLVIYGRRKMLTDVPATDSQSVGYVIPAVHIHGDIEFYYTVDIKTLTVKAYEVTAILPRRLSELPQTYMRLVEVYHG